MLRRLRVLVVEDEDLVRSVATDELRDAGFDVVEAASGDEALRAIDADPSLDALFTDIRLGAGPDGWEVAQTFRSRHPEDPVIYASGYSPGEPRRLSNSLFFPKPYRPSRITAALKLMLAASRWEPEAEAVDEPRDSAPAMLTRLTYMSRPTPLAHDPSPAEGLMRLTQQVRTINRAQGLTGALLAGAEWFIQVLEGERTALLAALERINRDPRHQDVRIFELTAASSRLFPDWAMHVGRTEEVEPELLWRCVEAFRQPGPLGAKLLLEALGRSARAAA